MFAESAFVKAECASAAKFLILNKIIKVAKIGLSLLTIGALAANPAFAQAEGEKPSVSQVAQNEAVTDCQTVPALTPLLLKLLTPLHSKTSKTGDFFDMELVNPIIICGQILISSGAKAKGQVVHAAKKSLSGKAGELLLAGRYLDFEGTQLAIRSLEYGPRSGRNDRIVTVGIGVFAESSVGRDFEIENGRIMTAKLSREYKFDRN